MRILLEMRPALDGHAGIPQETRLLFRTLAELAGCEVEGLIQSSNKVLPHADDPAAVGSSDRSIDRRSRVVVALQQNDRLGRVEWLGQIALRIGAPAAMLLRSALGLRTSLSQFDPTHFEDFLWRAMFAKSLPLADREIVVRKGHRVMRVPWGAAHFAGLLSQRLGRAVYPRLDTRGFDAFIAETPYPGRVHSSTALIVRYHDAIPLLMPHTIVRRGYHQASHYHSLRRNVRDGAWFACVSESTRRDLLSVFPEVEPRSVVIPNAISHEYHEEASDAARVAEIVWARRNRRAPHGGGCEIPPSERTEGRVDYLLVVATLEPRKNHLAVIDAWERLRTGSHPNLQLVFVGSLGWDHDAILNRAAPWLQRGGLHLLHDVPAADLRLLYRHARATVCPSFSEGFDFAGVESMCCGGVVVSSDIPVHREVYGDASLYFSPYAVDELVAVLRSLVETGDDAVCRRQALREAGERVARQYASPVVAEQWGRFLTQVVSRPG